MTPVSWFRTRWVRRIPIYFLIIVCIGGLTILLVAPYLPRLVAEGYPAAVWPAPGSFAQLPGGAVKGPISQPAIGIPTIGESLSRFEKDDGRALLVYRAGVLSLEHYADGFGPETRFNSFSLVKSLVGALVLRAVSKGLIASLDDPVGDYLPSIGDETFRSVPLLAFLRMRSGVMFSESGLKSASVPGNKAVEQVLVNPFGPMARLHMGGLTAVAEGLRADPNIKDFSYQNINTAILGAVLEAVYRSDLQSILSDEIWAPAGAADASWRQYDAQKPVSPYCCIYARPRDWIRVAAFLMKNGPDGAPFLRPDLWDEYFGRKVALSDRQKGLYDLHLYQNVLDRAGEPLQGPFSYMFGSKGQTVYMMPDKDLVVVRFGDGLPLLHSTLYAAWRSLPKLGLGAAATTR